QAILKLAQELDVPCCSCSQHRYSPGFIGMRSHPEVGRVLGCDVYGGYDVKAAAADKFILPLHSIETLYTIIAPGCVVVSAASTPSRRADACCGPAASKFRPPLRRRRGRQRPSGATAAWQPSAASSRERSSTARRSLATRESRPPAATGTAAR